MKINIYFVEQFIFAVTWLRLYGVIFSAPSKQKWVIGIIHMTLQWGITLVEGEIAARQIGAIISIGISSLTVAFLLKRKDINVVVEILIACILSKILWLLSIILTYFLLLIIKVDYTNKLRSGIIICAMQMVLCIFLERHGNFIRWKNLVNRYSLVIISASSILFVLSYAIVAVPYYQGERKFNNFAMLVIAASITILITWGSNDYQHRKELEAKSKHIDDLVRGAHRYKEIIPAVSRELRKIAQEMGGEVSSELSIAIEEVDQLWNMTARQDREERKKAPNLNQTGLPLLDGQLEQEWREADAAGVSFECVVISPVGELAERVELFHLMQLVGDLFRNALRAIQRSGGENGRILLFLGKRREGYEIKMRDTGAPFPKEVLERLGERGLTTGGTGHGMADMLETLARYRASLEIQEEMETTAFTKTVSLLFDNEAMVRVNCPAQSIVYERHLPELTKI